MSDEMQRHFGSSVTRRRVVKTGIKAAYAAPLVAASFKLTGSDAAAQIRACVCVSPDQFGFQVVSDPTAPLPGGVIGPGCCSCSCTVGTFVYDPVTNSCIPDVVGDVCTPTCVGCTRTVTI